MTARRSIIAAALAFALGACHPAAAPGPQSQARTVSVVKVELRPIAGGLTASGVLTPRNAVSVSADLTGYRVAQVLADEGDWVKAGQPLAQMDVSILRAQLDQQLALAAQQKALADQREAEAARVTGLEGQGVLSQEDLDARKFTARNARAAADAQAAAAREMQTRLDHLTVRAPVAGLIIQRSVKPGDISGGTTVWFQMAENGQIELYADVSEADFAQMHPGLAAKVTLDDDQVVDGVVRLVSPRVDSTTQLGQVRIALPVRADIRAGGYAKASFVDMTKDVPAVPETAVRYDANGASVMVVGADGRVSQVPVRAGERGGGYVELLSGPPPGSVVVAKAASQLLPGDPVVADYGTAGRAVSEPTRQLRISAWAIRNPTPVAVLFIALVIAGVFSYTQLPIKMFPNLDFPVVSVSVTQSGAAASQLKTQVTRPVEDALSGITNIEAITSVVTEGDSETRIEFDLGTDMQKATDDVRAKIDAVRAQLPREIDPPIVQHLDFGDQPIDTFAVFPAKGVTMSDADLSWIIDNDISRVLQSVPGVGQVARMGGVDREINVIVDPTRMAAQGITAPQINQALANVSLDAAGGRVQVGGREQTLRVQAAAVDVDQIRNLQITTPGGRYVRLSDVADVGDGSAEVRSEARYDGRPVVGFQVIKTDAASEISTENAVGAALKAMTEGTHGLFGPGAPPTRPDIVVRKIVSQVDATRGSFLATIETMLEGMALASLVVWLFLRDWRATAVTAVAMPVSLIPSFAFMGLVGFSLDTISLLALTLVIGILVDDAIVEIENIEKRVHVGMQPYDAALEGADQIGLAVVATTFALVVVFAPVSFMPGIPGQFFREFGVTVSVAVLFSLVTARLLTPLLAAYFLRVKPPKPRAPLPGFYVRSLQWALDHRIVSVLAGLAIFVLSVVLAVGVLPKGLQPEGNPDYYQLDIDTPPGSTLADTRHVVALATDLLARQRETEHVFTAIGGGGGGVGNGIPSSTGVDAAVAVAVLKPHRLATVAQIRDRLRPLLHAIPDARVTFEGAQFGGSTVQAVLTSVSGIGLDETALELQREMAQLHTLADPRPATEPPAPEVVIRPRPDDAARLGVSADVIAEAARVATVGDIDANVAKMDVGDRRIPIRVRLPASARSDLPTLKALRLPTASGGTTTLDSVADVFFQAGPAEITRYNRKDDLIMLGDLVGDAKLSDADREIDNLYIMRHLPPGISHEKDIGNQQAQSQLFVGFGAAIFSGIALVYAVMVLLFGSFFKPLTILSALPLTLAGAFVALLIAQSELSIPSMIGLFMLMGIASKNSILLVEYAIERERAGERSGEAVDRHQLQRDALFEACRERARPVVMTSLAMMAGMLPTALGLGEGSEFRQPMAIAVIGGLITSTVLSLVLVPVVYEFVDDFEGWLTPHLARLITQRDGEAVPVNKGA